MLASEIYGTAPTFIPAVPPQTAMTATDTATRGVRKLVDLNSPLPWFIGVVLVTVGAAGFAGSVRLGPAKVGASVGKS